MKTVVALYEDFGTARDVVEDLVDAGLMRDYISLVANDSSGQHTRHSGADEDVSAAEGAGFGAVVGGLIGLGAMLIPGVGPVIAAGPLVAGLTGAAVGAAAGAATGGIVGGLVRMGVAEDEAGYYAEGIHRGGTLVSVQINDDWESRVVDIMSRYRPIDIRRSAEEWRRSGWTGFDGSPAADEAPAMGTQLAQGAPAMRPTGMSDTEGASARPQATAGEMPRVRDAADTTFDSYDTDWRAHYSSTFGASGQDYSFYMPAYLYGYTLATDPRYSQYRSWDDVKSAAREEWESRGQGRWDDFANAVQYAWDRVRSVVG